MCFIYLAHCFLRKENDMSANAVETKIGTVYQTTQLSQMVKMLQTTASQTVSRLGEVYGEPGSGKTFATHYLVETMGAYRLCACEGMSKKDVLNEVAVCLGCDEQRPTYSRLLVWLRQELQRQRQENKSVILLVDEADCLRWYHLEPLRWLADEAGAVVILFGSEILQRTFHDPRSGAYLARMSSRIGTKRVALGALDLNALGAYVLNRHFKDMPSQETAKLFHEYTGGNWRVAEDLAQACQDILRNYPDKFSKLNKDCVQVAAKELGIKRRK
jgi:type II secretory pathway predicted ATPase ExeA